jgi:hypothetical protein
LAALKDFLGQVESGDQPVLEKEIAAQRAVVAVIHEFNVTMTRDDAHLWFAVQRFPRRTTEVCVGDGSEWPVISIKVGVFPNQHLFPKQKGLSGLSISFIWLRQNCSTHAIPPIFYSLCLNI